MKLSQDLGEFIELLISENVQYLLIGGWVYNRYAEPRFTGDIDFFVSTSLENQAKIRNVLIKFGFAEFLPAPDKSLFEKKILIFGRPPHRIDLISEIDGVSFDEAWTDREFEVVEDLKILFISKKLLLQNKKASGQDKDLLDVKNLEKFKRDFFSSDLGIHNTECHQFLFPNTEFRKNPAKNIFCFCSANNFR